MSQPRPDGPASPDAPDTGADRRGRDTGGPPARVRVTADATPHRPASSTRGIALPGDPAEEADQVFARALRRSQLRLALGTLVAFVAVMGVLVVVISLVPELGDVVLLGVPLSWLLHAYAFYPVIAFFAVAYLRSAARNERRYAALRGGE